MRKAITILFLFFSSYFFVGCKSSRPKPIVEGEWGDCNGYRPSEKITITKQGDVLILHRKNNDFTLEEKSDSLYTGNNGTITLLYRSNEQDKQVLFLKENDPKMYDSLLKTVKFQEHLKKGKWYLSGVTGESIQLCHPSEMN